MIMYLVFFPFVNYYFLCVCVCVCVRRVCVCVCGGGGGACARADARVFVSFSPRNFVKVLLINRMRGDGDATDMNLAISLIYFCYLRPKRER